MNLLRPESTVWFEILAPKMECAKSLGNLGRTGSVEIEVRPHEEELLNVRELAGGMEEYRRLYRLYHRYWSRNELYHAPASRSPQAVLQRALHGIADWRVHADSVIDDLQGMEEERTSLEYCLRFLEGIKDSDIDLSLTLSAGPVLTVVYALLPPETELVSAVPKLAMELAQEDETCFLAVTARDDAELLYTEIKSLDGRLIERPNWLVDGTGNALKQVRERLAWLDRTIPQRYAELDSLFAQYNLPATLGDVACLEWFMREVGTLEPVGPHLVWVTGWTTEKYRDRLGQILVDAGVPCLVHFPQPPEGMEPPKLLRNPWWSRPFELFTRAFGTPGSAEVDPSPLLAVIVPLLFGYMFADVGQGLVLLIAGFWLSRRWEGARLIMVAGGAASVFGFLFGSVFSYEGLLPALLFHPLQDPLLTLVLPIGFGAILLILGQLLEGLESWWRGELRAWLLQRSGLLLLYLGVLMGAMQHELVFTALFGAVWFLAGNALAAGHWYSVLGALGKLLEDGIRLLVNTVSFARVGAFALAHAGLSSAIVALANSTDSFVGSVLIILAGNALVIFLEGLVVSIQTTRLVLFEFFMRFFHGTGRPFRPLALPPEVANVPPSNV